MREVRRVLRPDGVFWLNIGDSWSGGSRKTSLSQSSSKSDGANRGYPVDYSPSRDLGSNYKGIKPLDMILIPEQLAIAARADGWYIRSILVWAKGASLSEEYNGNPMPESVNGWRWGRHKVPQCPNCESYSSFRQRVCKVCGWTKPSNRGVGPNTGSNNKEPYQGNNPHTMRLEQESKHWGVWRRDHPDTVQVNPPRNRANSRPLESAIHAYRGNGWEKQAIEGRKPEAWRAETGQQEHDSEGGFRSDSFMVDCPGCVKCEKAGGLVLRKGSWRPTDSYEQILMLTKTNDYFCDREAVLEPITDSTRERVKSGLHHRHPADVGVGIPPVDTDVMGERFGPDGGRNLRSVLMIPTVGFPGAHFAVFPVRLMEPLIKAATSERGCCPKCGAPYARIVERSRPIGAWHDHSKDDEMGQAQSVSQLNYASKYKVDGATGLNPQGYVRTLSIEKEREQSRVDAKRLFPDDGRAQQDYINYIHNHHTGQGQYASFMRTRKVGEGQDSTIGWLPTCSCDAGDPIPCRVLDPFSGAGTSSLACERLGLDSIGIDTSAVYIQMARERLENDKLKNKGGKQ